jgi:2-keto-4-pentenoate hydratase/2-oxohepta-3-ene-1,7-dioic acid hydratase in catechol pathway
MRLVTFRHGASGPTAGILSENKVTGTGMDMLELISSGIEPVPFGPSYDLADVTLLAPIQRPPKFICVGLNYHDHATESKMAVATVPTIFSKFSNVVIGPGETIVLPRVSTQPDYEAELAVVIGPGGRGISSANAMDHVFGYTIANDVSARDLQLATSQFLIGKTCDTFAPIGPYIATKDEIADPHALDISLEIGGEILQNSNTRELIFKIPQLIEFISAALTLEPGDIISTGTPSGVGFARKPPRYLKDGDECIVRIQGLGELRNPCAAEK